MEMSFNVNAHLIDLKGKKYLQVMHRLVWFREDHPDWNIDTAMTHYDPESKQAIFVAKILDANGIQKSSATGSESARDFADFIEKAETKAVGRALAMLGYGTQFAPELDEGERIVDSPVPKAKPAEEMQFKCADCGAVLKPVKVGQKTYGVREWAAGTEKEFGRPLCTDCRKKAKEAKAAE